MTAADQLLTDLRTLDVRVCLDGGTVWCKAIGGTITPKLAVRIRGHKAALLVLLAAEAEEIAWRVVQIGCELLADAPGAEGGICPWCWMPTLGRAGKCVFYWALASADDISSSWLWRERYVVSGVSSGVIGAGGTGPSNMPTDPAAADPPQA